MTKLTDQVGELLERLKRGDDLTPEDLTLLIPVTERFHERLLSDGRTRFQHVFGGYIVGDTHFPESVGLSYLHNLLQAAAPVSCLYLASGPLLPTGTESAEGKAARSASVVVDFDDFEGRDFPATNVTNAQGVFNTYDPVMDPVYRKSVENRVKELEESDPDSNELEFLKDELAEHIFHGRMKGHEDEKEKARQSVRKAIRSAISKLIENPDTQYIGIHLKTNIKLGHDCEYMGIWRWKFD